MEHRAIPFAFAFARPTCILLKWIIYWCISAAIQNRVTFVYTIEQSAGVEVLPRCVNDMGRELPATGGQNASPLHNHDHRQPTLLPSPLTPSSSLPWFADTLKTSWIMPANPMFFFNSPPPLSVSVAMHMMIQKKISVSCNLKRIPACFRCVICISSPHTTIVGRKRDKNWFRSECSLS